MKRKVFNHLKNIIGWRTNRKILVISVDDYGNVRLASKSARESMDRAGLKIFSRFDMFDTLETKQDLEMLYDTLSSVNDKNGRHAVFTPFALPSNIDFEAMKQENYSRFISELLPQTYLKLSSENPESYDGAWSLWEQGVSEGLMVPQFHGREHLNLKSFEEKLAKRDQVLLTSLKNASFTSIGGTDYNTVSETAAFDFWDFEENYRFKEIIHSGLDAFESVFGYKSVYFNSPGGNEHPFIHKILNEKGVKFIDTPMIKQEHQGLGNYKRVFNYTGKKNADGQVFLVRNVVFEPTFEELPDWVNFSMDQIEAAFFWKRPAIISSHRVNFCGHIDPENRKIGLNSLKKLLKEIVKKWPDVEFMAAHELGELIIHSLNKDV